MLLGALTHKINTPYSQLTPLPKIAPIPLEVAEIGRLKYRETIRATLIHPWIAWHSGILPIRNG
jgi:hypothetical protein